MTKKQRKCLELWKSLALPLYEDFVDHGGLKVLQLSVQDWFVKGFQAAMIKYKMDKGEWDE